MRHRLRTPDVRGPTSTLPPRSRAVSSSRTISPNARRRGNLGEKHRARSGVPRPTPNPLEHKRTAPASAGARAGTVEDYGELNRSKLGPPFPPTEQPHAREGRQPER